MEFQLGSGVEIALQVLALLPAEPYRPTLAAVMVDALALITTPEVRARRRFLVAGRDLAGFLHDLDCLGQGQPAHLADEDDSAVWLSLTPRPTGSVVVELTFTWGQPVADLRWQRTLSVEEEVPPERVPALLEQLRRLGAGLPTS